MQRRMDKVQREGATRGRRKVGSEAREMRWTKGLGDLASLLQNDGCLEDGGQIVRKVVGMMRQGNRVLEVGRGRSRTSKATRDAKTFLLKSGVSEVYSHQCA